MRQTSFKAHLRVETKCGVNRSFGGDDLKKDRLARVEQRRPTCSRDGKEAVAGFTEEGILRDYVYWREVGTFSDARMYALVRREYAG